MSVLVALPGSNVLGVQFLEMEEGKFERISVSDPYSDHEENVLATMISNFTISFSYQEIRTQYNDHSSITTA